MIYIWFGKPDRVMTISAIGCCHRMGGYLLFAGRVYSVVACFTGTNNATVIEHGCLKIFRDVTVGAIFCGGNMRILLASSHDSIVANTTIFVDTRMVETAIRL